MIFDKRDTRDIVRFVVESALVIIVGCIIYRIIAVLHMEILGIEPLDYKGADNISISGMIIALPQSIMKCYRYFWQYFFTDSFVRYNLYQHLAIIRYIFVAFMLLIIGVRIWGAHKRAEIWCCTAGNSGTFGAADRLQPVAAACS